AVNGDTYRVARSFHTARQQQAAFERVLPDGKNVPVIEDGGIKPINAKISFLLGLDYETFSRVIMLPQGQFAEFLRGDRQTRRRIISRLLDAEKFERAAKLARERAKAKSDQEQFTREHIKSQFADATLEHQVEL